MPIIFVHGVSNRRETPSYQQGIQIRSRMVQKIIGPSFSKFPSMTHVREVYWGDLGVKFLWDMQCLPLEVTFEAAPGVAVANDPVAQWDNEAVGLASFLEQQASFRTPVLESADRNQSSPILMAAKNDPIGLIDSFISPLADGLVRNEIAADPRSQAKFSETANFDAIEIADLLINADSAKSDEAFLKSFSEANSELQLFQLLASRLTPAPLGNTQREKTDTLESVGLESASNALGWLRDKAEQANQWAKDKWSDAKSDASRSASVWLLQKYREQVSKGGFLFLGDIFEYIRRGQGAAGTISQSVRSQIQQLAGENRLPNEPLVVISHSFGGEVVYDLLTNGQLTDISIDLWVTVGSQVGLFAEMSIFESSPEKKPAGGHLPKPAGVSNWINVYDTVDIFSFLCEPVFGNSAVRDIKIGTGSAKSAHGDYFLNPQFYKTVLNFL